MSSTLSSLFLERVLRAPLAEAFLIPEGTGWKSFSWKQVEDEVRAAALGLHALGLGPEERCAVLAGTRYEWILADLGVLCAGGATTSIYPSTRAEECAFILGDSGARFAIVENAEQAAKLFEHKRVLSGIEKVISIEGEPLPDGWGMSWSQLLSLGRAQAPRQYEALVSSVRPEHLATIIYTSGTTGRPKGVELTHGNWVYQAEAAAALNALGESDRQYLWLPLAHSFGKTIEATQLKIGFASAIDGRVEQMIDNLGVVKPTFMLGVPRVFEKIRNKIIATAHGGSSTKAYLFDWAVAVGHEASARRLAGRRLSLGLAARHAIADRLVFRKVRARFGGRFRFFLSGSAKLSEEVARFFDAVGLKIAEGYGLTETSAGGVVNRLEKYKLGSVGYAMSGTQVRIAPEDGEILIKGPGVMRGYHRLPMETSAAFTDDGWFRTGDIGELDKDGFLTLTDRKKDLFKTSNGKYIAPQYLEGKLKALCPFLSDVVVFGEGRKFICALLSLDRDEVGKWAQSQGCSGASDSPELRALLQGYVDAFNAQLPSFSTLKSFHVLQEELSLESGELTASMKVKRRVVEARYRHVLERIYEEPSVVPKRSAGGT